METADEESGSDESVELEPEDVEDAGLGGIAPSLPLTRASLELHLGALPEAGAAGSAAQGAREGRGTNIVSALCFQKCNR